MMQGKSIFYRPPLFNFTKKTNGMNCGLGDSDFAGVICLASI
jgi:hypothetical protein